MVVFQTFSEYRMMNKMPSNAKIENPPIRDNPATKLRLGIIGCGAIAEGAHIPAALATSKGELTALSDNSEHRLRQIQAEFGIGPIGFTDYRQIFDKVDAVVLALPNTLHAPIASEFLSRKIHVLCEKPLASTSQECETMCRAAQESGVVLAVGYVTRFHPSTELTRELVHSGFLGVLQSFNYEFGTAGGWATQSGYNLTRASAGGGVLVVSGSHFIDRMLYFFDSADVVEYADDNYGGVEANCVVRLTADLQGYSVPGTVTLSKTHRLSNRLRIIGEKGTLEVREGQSDSVTFFPAGGEHQYEISSRNSPPSPDQDYFQVQLEDFLDSIQLGRAPKINGIQGSKSVVLMERCYQIATRLDEPWSTATLDRLQGAIPPGESTDAHLSAAKSEAS
jgi:predicted dehydrogenase